jgi:hypothetical protein
MAAFKENSQTEVSLHYDPWTGSLLQHLEATGPIGAATADYIHQNNIRVSIVDNNATNMWWKAYLTPLGLRIRPALYVSRFIANLSFADPWALMLFVHETVHLRQGFRTAMSVYGEMEAWQTGFRFYQTLPDCRPLSPPVQELLTLPLNHSTQVLRQARDLINQDQNGGMPFHRQVRSVLSKEKAFGSFYWINALPLNPFPSKETFSGSPRI